jgi:hypothetical protein
MVLLTILNVRLYLTATGKWHNLVLKGSIYDTPAFKTPRQFMSQDDIEKLERRKRNKKKAYNEADIRGKVNIIV